MVPLDCKGSVVLILVHRPKKTKKTNKLSGNENLAHIKYGLFFFRKEEVKLVYKYLCILYVVYAADLKSDRFLIQ